VLSRLVPWLRLGYNEVQYWLVGLMPETYHARAAFLWSELGNYRRSVEHCKRYLAVANSDSMKHMLAYCYGHLGKWPEAADTLRSVTDIWNKPSLALSLAEAEWNSGNVLEARQAIAAIEVCHRNLPGPLLGAIESLKGRMSSGSGAQQAVAADRER
jgi:tetratricopeptide (TPR) repeat protein